MGAYTSGPIDVIVDLGTSLITGPTADNSVVASHIGAKWTIITQYTIDCDKVDNIPEIGWTLDGTEYTATEKKLALESVGIISIVFFAFLCGRLSIIDHVFVVSNVFF